MKKLFFIFVILGFSSSVVAETIKAHVPGMVCPLCLVGIQKQFKKDVEDPKRDIVLDLENKTVTIYTKQNISDNKIKKKIKDGGYKVQSIERIPDQNSDSDKDEKKNKKNVDKEEKENQK
ncbi:MAG: hypothetical protein KDD52_03995 [Bdellovibrionales bacterium]|nr:hypothetical protein [Bdellovibrionales bacterium]